MRVGDHWVNAHFAAPAPELRPCALCFLAILVGLMVQCSWTIRTLWSWWTIHNMKKFSKSNMLQGHIWNAHCSRCMFAICSWSSMLFKYGPGACLEYSRLLMVHDHKVLRVRTIIMVLDHKSRPKCQKSALSWPGCNRNNFTAKKDLSKSFASTHEALPLDSIQRLRSPVREAFSYGKWHIPSWFNEA